MREQKNTLYKTFIRKSTNESEVKYKKFKNKLLSRPIIKKLLETILQKFD